MTCIDPPQLDAVVLLAHLDGEADERVKSHLDACDHCRARAAALGEFQGEMTRRLYRHDCPDPLMLAEYQAGLLDSEQKRAAARHVEDCPHCLAELDMLRNFRAEVAGDIDVTALDRIQVVIGRLLQGSPGFGAELQPASVRTRGGEDGPAVYQAGKTRIAVETARDPTDASLREVYGVVSSAGTAKWEITLLAQNATPLVGQTDEFGNFHLAQVGPATYDLSLHSTETEIRIPGFEVS